MPNSEFGILLVEDNENDIELTLLALRGEKLVNEIHVARDGEEALTFLAECERRLTVDPRTGAFPKLILLDLKLPKLDGLEVLSALKKNPLTQHIPVVVLTSSKQDPDLAAAYRLGVNSYIQKPLNFDQFRSTVKQLGMYWLLINQLPSSALLTHK